MFSSNYSTFSARSFGPAGDEEDPWPTSQTTKKVGFPLLVPLLLGVGIVFSVVITVQSYVSQSSMTPVIPLSEASALNAASTSSIAGMEAAAATGVRTLLLMRHAHAVAAGKEEADEDDRARPLTESGNAESVRVGQYLANKQVIPDIIISSDSVRTKQTVQHVLEGLRDSPDFNPDNVPVIYNANVYTAKNAKDLLAIVKAVESKYTRVMVVGHNPPVQELGTAAMGGATEPQDMLSMVMGGFAPAAVAVYAFRCGGDQSWDSSCVALGKGILTRYIDPAALAPVGDAPPENPFLKPKHHHSDDDSSSAPTSDSDVVPADTSDANPDDEVNESTNEALRVMPGGIHHDSQGTPQVDDANVASDSDVSTSGENWSSSQDDSDTVLPDDTEEDDSSSQSSPPSADDSDSSEASVSSESESEPAADSDKDESSDESSDDQIPNSVRKWLREQKLLHKKKKSKSSHTPAPNKGGNDDDDTSSDDSSEKNVMDELPSDVRRVIEQHRRRHNKDDDKAAAAPAAAGDRPVVHHDDDTKQPRIIPVGGHHPSSGKQPQIIRPNKKSDATHP